MKHWSKTMLLAHRIRLDPSAAQRDYFARAAGTARRVWNWGLAEWLRQRDAGGKPNAMALKKQFNAIKYIAPDWCDKDGRSWLKTMHRDAHAQPFVHLGRAWSRYFEQIKAKLPAHQPRFKKKGRCPDSFYVANDKFRLEGMNIVLPKIGSVALREALRLDGRIMGATVQREAGHWYVSVQVKLALGAATRTRTGDGVTGVDLGISAAATLDTGEAIASPRPLKAALRRLRIRSRRASRKFKAAKAAAGICGAIPKGTRLPVSSNRTKAAQAMARLHARIAAVRSDFTHKLTTRLCRENQTVVIEDLHVKGMLANGRLARSLSDIGFGRIRRQLEYKALRYGTHVMVADRWYASSKICSGCGFKHATLALNERAWTCGQCGAQHDRDRNAAINLQRLAAGAADLCSGNALPVASRTATSGTAPGAMPVGGGEVTPVRYEFGQQDGSGQEEDAAYNCARL
jgi:putative transposase